MSRPRKPFGANHPGRLPATMIKVLAAEMSDPSRLRRGKQYAKDGSVLDIVVEPGIVTGEVQGSRATPYIASVEVSAGDGMPLRRDVSTACTCPDDDNWDDYACKHVIATLFVLSDEFLLEPELLDVWRQQTPANVAGPPNDGPPNDDPPGDDRPDRTRRHLHLVGSERTAPAPLRDPLAGLLAVPNDATLPEIPTIERVEADLPQSRQLASSLRDALAHLRIEWD